MSIRYFKRHRLAALAALALGLCLADNALAGDAAKGKIDFTQKFGCFQCHGTVGQGGVAGLKLAPDPLPWEGFSTFVRTTNRKMPPYSKDVLTDEDLADIYAYLQSVPKGPNAKDIPILNN